VIIGRVTGRLNYKDVTATDILQDFHHDFAIGKTPYSRLSQRNTKVAANFFGKPFIGIASKNHFLFAKHDVVSSC
jgi:hypothetical protein